MTKQSIIETIYELQPKSIGVLGLARSGKDTVAQMLAEALPQYTELKYAAPLRKLSQAVFGHCDDSLKHIPLYMNSTTHDAIVIGLEQLCSDMQIDAGVVFTEAHKLLNYTSISPRILQQCIGDAIRAYDCDAFVKYAHSRTTPALLSDVRYGNELCEFNVLVHKKGIKPMKHSSEAYAQHVMRCMEMHHKRTVYLSGYPVVLLENNGTLADLRKNIGL